MKPPKYQYGDEVYIYGNIHIEYIRCMDGDRSYDSETINVEDRKSVKLDGIVYIIDHYGTWDNNNEEPSYDIYVPYCNCLYKHITESDVYSYK